jgi:hypothetical protein
LLVSEVEGVGAMSYRRSVVVMKFCERKGNEIML